MKNKPLLIVLAVAFLLRFVGLVPNVLHPDEGYVQVYSWDLVRNIVTSADFHPHTFKYGSFIFYFQALATFPIFFLAYLAQVANTLFTSSFSSQIISFAAFHEKATRDYYETLTFLGRAEVALFGIVSVYIVYLIGKKLFSKRVGLLAALLLAVSPLHVRDSHYITTDVPAVFFFLLSFYFLVNLVQEKKRKWFALSGFFLGLSSTIRYFPVAVLVYPIALLLSFERKKEWFRNLLTSLVFIFLGVFSGVPFLFLDPGAPKLFARELEQYILPWYQTSLSSYVFSLASFIVSFGKTSLPPLGSLVPTFFRPFHANYVFFNGFWPIPTILGILGAFFVLFRAPKKFILLVVIPLATFIYSSFYVRAAYERLIIPVLPFLAIFAGVFIEELSRRIKPSKAWMAALVALAAIPPFLISFSASYACGQKSTRELQAEFIEKNIPEGAKISHTIPVTFPSQKNFELFNLEPDANLSLEEVRALGADYAFINIGRLDYIFFPEFINNFFIVPEEIYENSYYSLVLSEYRSRAQLLGKAEKPFMCDTNRTYFYKIPKAEAGKIGEKKSLEKSDFQRINDKLVTQPIKIERGKVYTFSAHMRLSKNQEVEDPRAFLRMDFYNLRRRTFLGRLYSKLEKIGLLLKYGMTPVYFEKKRDTKVVALSPRTSIDEAWKDVAISAKAPENGEYAVLSIYTPLGLQKDTDLRDLELVKSND